jgi:hypothetical protein
MSALIMPLSAYAAEAGGLCLPAVSNEMTEDPAEPEKTPVLADIFIPEELPEPEETLITEEIPISEENPAILESNESAIPDIPFTPDGQATVVDWVFDFDGKEFYTFTSPAGNVFYLRLRTAFAPLEAVTIISIFTNRRSAASGLTGWSA